jgi:hypothetical protein
MSEFDDITLSYDGVDYHIKGNNVFNLIARLEEVITIGDITPPDTLKPTDKWYPKLTKIAAAYCEMLNYAGAATNRDKVYKSLFGDNKLVSAKEAIEGLYSVMVPPEEMQVEVDEASSKKLIAQE